ncbi:MAG: phosphoenolpyruvate--protein phosphotransferase [Zetaproteobacteria bacterium CG12_big_fil_rev_8_21_14_0_65_54_13]|nr:MAG: phosphoenolpyruvate--protein phosphotransferase [Zetaproteobacteria bacterium CG23_combo_of_CG06-09_8_20_14_all_54_7]PIW48205.1 MAG: phosphoenolpyruvate--protein phosphotransferase [Zetaproteobacteria bacterium CG12_big_fil_rev_8_21_14_0_65_54_13]PIX54184.1 MAG: phosphoenolpyruvate--protein phosphotransferase [Zetaproteobacteria bacterium CG_4_10_14_3_um_filter_54_28]PJA27017.1 MAG: phosphoenolpyruvate--protein phosphotransferase [Zetaproteobacteria bacterium CG_4_9_14_3_um_filter_54_145
MSTRPRSEGRAVAASPGIVIGYVQKLIHGRKPIPERRLAAGAADMEVARLKQAVKAAVAEIDLEREQLSKLGSQDPLMVLDAHRMMIADPELAHMAGERVIADNINAEWALRQQMDAIQAIFNQSDNAYLRGRQHDVEQAGQHILNQLMGQQLQVPADTAAASDPERPIIYVGEDFSVSDIVQMWRQGVAAIITEQGGNDAHNIIVARGIGLPALVGAAGILKEIEDGDLLILDGEQCLWTLNPSAAEELAYEKFIEAVSISREGLAAFALQPSRSKDGREMKLMANIEFLEELDMAEQIGIDGVGLFRSEFLFLNCKEQPDEDLQYRCYAAIIRRMSGKPVTMRLLDVGGDKACLYKQATNRDYSGSNPVLGLRGIRLLLRSPQLLSTQLRAMLRAGEHGPLHILVPMVTSRNEMLQVRKLAEQLHDGMHLKQPLSIGAMIEVPAAVLVADSLAEISDFFSIGTNDLIQYTLAADRSDDEVASLYQPEHPAIQQLIYMTALAAKKAGIPLSVCGELAANPEWTEQFLNLDMHALSMSMSNILPIRRFLSKQSYHPALPPAP